MVTPAPCIICSRERDEAGSNQPVGGLAFECHGHWPSSIFDSESTIAGNIQEVDVAQQVSPIHALLARLLDGWAPQAGEIDPDVPQADALNWRWSVGGRKIGYQTIDRNHRVSSEVVYTDPHMAFALTIDAMLWLYDDEESEKVRYLGG